MQTKRSTESARDTPAPSREAAAQAAAREAGRSLRQQLATAEDAGYFGLGSAMWRLNREAVLGLGLGRALLLQLAHPWVAQAVADHSAFRARPLDRLVGTITAAELLVFGSRSQADAVAMALVRQHARIGGTLREATGAWKAGTVYSAGDPDALLWVLVTLLDTSIRLYEACLRRLDDRTVRDYLADGARLGEMLGVPAQTVPDTRETLADYIGKMISSGAVAVGPTARTVATALVQAPAVPGLSWHIYSALTHMVASVTLPEELRAQYGSLLSPERGPLFRSAAVIGPAVLPRLPDRLRLDPLAAIAIRRAGLGLLSARHSA